MGMDKVVVQAVLEVQCMALVVRVAQVVVQAVLEVQCVALVDLVVAQEALAVLHVAREARGLGGPGGCANA